MYQALFYIMTLRRTTHTLYDIIGASYYRMK